MIKVKDIKKYLQDNDDYKLEVRINIGCVGCGEWVVGQEPYVIGVNKDDKVVYLDLEGGWEDEEDEEDEEDGEY